MSKKSTSRNDESICHFCSAVRMAHQVDLHSIDGKVRAFCRDRQCHRLYLIFISEDGEDARGVGRTKGAEKKR